MANKSAVKAIVLSELNSTALTGLFISMFDGGLPQACFLLNLTNGGTTTIFVSFNGSDDHEQVLPGERVTINAQTNNQPSSNLALFAKGQNIFIRGTAGTSGVISISGYYVPIGV